jgi:hypothetical protein
MRRLSLSWLVVFLSFLSLGSISSHYYRFLDRCAILGIRLSPNEFLYYFPLLSSKEQKVIEVSIAFVEPIFLII